MRQSKNILYNIDWLLVLLYFLLVFLGWINIYAAVYNEEHSSILDMSQKYGKQLISIGAAVILILVILATDGSIFEKLAYPIFISTVLLLVLVLLFGREISGARSWFSFGGFSIQPSEFAKFGTGLALAKYLSTLNINMGRLKTKLISFGIFLLPMALIVLQNDKGSALVFTAFILVLYREGLSANYIAIGIAVAVLSVLALLYDALIITYCLLGLGAILIFFARKSKRMIVRIGFFIALSIGFLQTIDYGFHNLLKEYQQRRINIVLGIEEDPSGIGYNTEQSKIAIGSGGFSGKGFLEGTQTKFDFVPEQSTDFIFCTVGEEWGFIGSTFVIVLFMVLLFRIIQIAERQKSAFSRIYGYGVASVIFIHFTINIAMTVGLAPVIGIPLPFFSAGGSSLWGFTLLLFIFIRLDSYRMEIL